MASVQRCCQEIGRKVRGEFITDESVSELGRVQFQDHLNGKAKPLSFVSIRAAVWCLDLQRGSCQ